MRPTPSLSRSAPPRARRNVGVTLIELIVVITITGIIAVVLGQFILRPIQGYEAQVRRAELVDAAEMALRRTALEIRQALPNSVRIRNALGGTGDVTCNTAGQVCTIEILNTLDGARYRFDPGTVPGGHPHPAGVPWTIYRLQVPGLDSNGFNIVGFFENFPFPLPFDSAAGNLGQRLAIYNQGAVPTVACTGTAADAYSDANCPAGSPVVMTNPNVVQFRIAADDGGDELRISPALPGQSFNFRWASPNQRVFIVDTPISFVCTAGPNGNITRYANYPITAMQQVTPAGAANIALLSRPVSACRFSYAAGTSQRAGLVTLDITVSDADSGEQVRLLHQVHVDNAP